MKRIAKLIQAGIPFSFDGRKITIARKRTHAANYLTTVLAYPAYGRDYRNEEEEVERDWKDGKDFMVVDPPRWIGGPYFNIDAVPYLRDQFGYDHIMFFNNDNDNMALMTIEI